VGILLGACFALAGPVAFAKSSEAPAKVDVVIIGGGLSALVTAYQLKKDGVSYHILEAGNKIGGRVRTVRYPSGLTADAGMEEYWVGNPAVSLISELGLPVESAGSLSTIVLDGKIWPYLGESKEVFLKQVLGEKGYADLKKFDLRLGSIFRTMETMENSENSRLLGLTRISFQDFVETNMRDRLAREWIRVTLEIEVGTTWDKISALDGAKEYYKFWKDLGNFHVEGGNSRFTEALGNAIGRGHISTGMKVTRVVSGPHSAKVHYVDTDTNDYHVIEGSAVVNTVPLHKVSNIQFEPPLPAVKLQAIKSMEWGTYLKAHVFVSAGANKHWMNEGKSVLPILTDGQLGAVYKGSAPGSDGRSILTLLMFGETAEKYMGLSMDQVRKEIMRGFEKLWPGFSRHIEGVELHTYGVESIAAWPVGRSRFDALSAALREPSGRVFFAGDMTESSHSDGAAVSGARAAKQILDCARLLEPVKVK
jgi:monoamine oxidase